MKNTFLIAFSMMISGMASYAQAPLKKKLWNGLQTILLPDSLANTLPVKKANGVLVVASKLNSTSYKADVRSNDVLISINNNDIFTPEDLYESTSITNLRVGENITYKVIRSGKIIELSTTIVGRADETNDKLNFVYSSIPFQGGELNAITSYPKSANGKKIPGILFIQGYTCAQNIDMTPLHPYRRLCDQLSEQGFAVMRIEKPGMGDSKNTKACDKIDFEEETQAFESALLALRNDPAIDQENIFIWGHSMGGIIAPKLGAKYNWIKGIAVYGTLPTIWGEYLEDMFTIQQAGMGDSPISIEKNLRELRTLIYEIYVLKKDPKKVAKKYPKYDYVLKEILATRSIGYNQQLDDQNTIQNWLNTKANVLAMYGEADIQALNENGTKQIVNAINSNSPRKAIYQFVPKTDHSFAKVGTIEDGYKTISDPNYWTILTENYNPEIGTITTAWMLEVIHPAPTYTWTKQNTEPYAGKQDDVFFLNEQQGWYCHGQGKLYNTRNGGDTWNLLWEKPGTYFRCLAFIDSLHGFVGNVGMDYFPGVTDSTCMYETYDGGKSWKPVTKITGPYPKGLCAIDVYQQLFNNAGKDGYRPIIRAAGRVGSPAFLMTSFDNGKTWKSEDMSAHTKMIFDVKFLTSDVGFICGASSEEIENAHALILKTNDGGKTWKIVYESSRPFELTWKCSFPTEKTGYVTIQNYDTDSKNTERFVAKTIDGGDTWFEIKLTDDHAVREFGIGFIDENTGWVGTTIGGFQTTNGGLSWTRSEHGLYTNKYRILSTQEGKKVIGIGKDLYQLEVK
jgi:photosystem II stability/assembly factor-like uncharacterized protein/alpha-beta hydrolase superfamily lysophospholipase